MVASHPKEKYIRIEYSNFDTPEIAENDIVVPVIDFQIFAGFPGYNRDVHVQNGLFIYRNYIGYTRIVTPYTSSERNGFKDSYTETSIKLQDEAKEYYLFILEGVFIDLNAWVDWEIVAEDIEIKLLETKF
jgi:hypothetical protein